MCCLYLHSTVHHVRLYCRWHLLALTSGGWSRPRGKGVRFASARVTESASILRSALCSLWCSDKGTSEHSAACSGSCYSFSESVLSSGSSVTNSLSGASGALSSLTIAAYSNATYWASTSSMSFPLAWIARACSPSACSRSFSNSALR